MPSPEVTRKRGREGGADDARPHKRRSLGTSASASTPESNSAPAAAAAAKPDPPALTGPPDGHRRFDEWKGVMYGYERIVHGNGAMFPTNYQINFNEPEPWTCPMGTCRKPFPQSAQLGAHFSRSHRKLLLVEEIRRGFFWEYGERKNPDKDGRFRSIVVHREFFEPPKHRRFGSDRQPPEDWEMYVNPTAVKDFKPGAPRPPQDAVAPAAPASMTSAAAFVPRPSAAPVTATPRSNAINATAARPPRAPAAFTAAPPVIVPTAPRAMRVTHPASRSGREIIDLSSDNEDVKPVVKDTPVRNTVSRVPPSQEQARGKTKNNGAANRVRKNGHGAMFDVNNPQELGGAQHHRNLFASWKQEAGAQHLEDSSSTSNSEDDDDSDPFDFEPSNLPVLRQNATQQQETGTDTSPIVLADSKQPSDPSKSAIWRYLMTLTKTEIPVPNDRAIIELLTLPKRRNLPITWQNRLSKFEEFHLTTLTALVLYIGGDEASNSPCKWMGCSIQTEVNAFYEIEFNHGSWIDYRGWKKEAPWKNMVPNEQIKAARHAERAEVMKNASTSINKSAGTSLSMNTPSTMPITATLTSKAGNDAVQLSLSQTSLPGCPPLQPTTMVRDTTTPRAPAQQADTKSNGTMSKARPHDTKSGQVTPTIQPSHGPLPPSGSQVSLPNATHMLSAKRNEERNNMVSSRLREQTQPSHASTTVASTLSQAAVVMQQAANPQRVRLADSAQWLVTENTGDEPESADYPVSSDSNETGKSNLEALKSGRIEAEKNVRLTAKEKAQLWFRRRMEEKKMKQQQARLQNDEQLGLEHYSPTSQAQGTLVSSAAASLSNLSVQDTSTAPSTSWQQNYPENSQEAAIINPANKSPQFLGLQGEETQLLQASRRHTLECTVVAGSMKVKTIKNGGMAITSRVNASETWTVDPDCQCLVSNFFPAVQEVAVLKVKSKPVLASKE